MSNAPRVVAKPALGAAPDQARDARVRAWSYAFACFAKKNAAGVPSSNGDDTKEGLKDDFRANTILPQ